MQYYSFPNTNAQQNRMGKRTIVSDQKNIIVSIETTKVEFYTKTFNVNLDQTDRKNINTKRKKIVFEM